jgi:hypothetical protein
LVADARICATPTPNLHGKQHRVIVLLGSRSRLCHWQLHSWFKVVLLSAVHGFNVQGATGCAYAAWINTGHRLGVQASLTTWQTS